MQNCRIAEYFGMQEVKVEADICINYLSDVSEPVGFAAGYEVNEITSGLIQGFSVSHCSSVLTVIYSKSSYTDVQPAPEKTMCHITV